MGILHYLLAISPFPTKRKKNKQEKNCILIIRRIKKYYGTKIIGAQTKRKFAGSLDTSGKRIGKQR